MDIERTDLSNAEFFAKTSQVRKMMQEIADPLLQRIDEFLPHRETGMAATALLQEAAAEIRALEAKLAELLPWALMGAEMLEQSAPSAEDWQHAHRMRVRINVGEFGEMP
jgi:hypothetical protein